METTPDGFLPVRRFFENEDDAIECGFNSMENNDLLAMFVDDVWKWIETVQQRIDAPMHATKAPIAV